MSNVLILGGTGFVGRSVCARLVARAGAAGGCVAVATRRAASAKQLQLLPTVEVIQADVHDPAQLGNLVKGRDAVVNLVAVLHGSDTQFRQVHVSLPRKLAQACLENGVRRLVHVSALGVALGDAAPSRYLRSKAAGETMLKAARLDLTLLRPSVIFGQEDRFLNLLAQLQAVVPILPLASANARFQPVWVEDVAAAIAHCLADPTTIGLTLECTGPSVHTLAELAALAGRWSGHERPVLALPAGLARLQALAMECLPGTPLMSRDNLDSMRVPSVASGLLPGLERLGIRASDMQSVVPIYLGSAHGVARLEALRARARRI
ncbi:MAG: complex I NDUFA9 subunit family protein [Burkholderiaceae bacterium]